MSWHPGNSNYQLERSGAGCERIASSHVLPSPPVASQALNLRQGTLLPLILLLTVGIWAHEVSRAGRMNGQMKRSGLKPQMMCVELVSAIKSPDERLVTTMGLRHILLPVKVWH